MWGEGVRDDENRESRGTHGGLEAREVGEVIGVTGIGESTSVEIHHGVWCGARLAEPESLEAIGQSHDLRNNSPPLTVLLVDFNERGAYVPVDDQKGSLRGVVSMETYCI